MFAPQYFAPTYFGPRFFPPGSDVVVQPAAGGTAARGFQPILSPADLAAKRERDRQRRLALGRMTRVITKEGLDAVDFDDIIQRMQGMATEDRAQEKFLSSPSELPKPNAIDQSQERLPTLRSKLRSRRLRFLLLHS